MGPLMISQTVNQSLITHLMVAVDDLSVVRQVSLDRLQIGCVDRLAFAHLLKKLTTLMLLARGEPVNQLG